MIDIINKRIRRPFFDFLFFNITNLANLESVFIFVLALVVFKKSRLLGIEVFISLAISSIIVQILKRLFSRNRPYWIIENLNTYGIDLRDYSFPSGHTTASFCIAVIFFLNYINIGIGFLILAFLIAISRIYLAVHYPTDVLAGIIIGTITSLIVHYKIIYVIFRYIK